MKKLFLTAFVLLSIGMYSQSSGYRFTVVKENPITSIKNQGNSGTCWSFSGIAFLESELIRTGKGEYDLSEMYIVRRNYADKADKYVRVGGNLNFAQGGSFADVVETLDTYGVLPNEAYTGLNYGETTHKHGEVEAGLSGYVKGVTENKNRRISPVWATGFNGILDAYFGTIPQNFQYQGKSYTPKSFAQSLGLESGNYISLTSFNHHPFYAPFALEIPDNWRWALSYNLPIDEFMQVFDYAVNNGYTVAWATDVSEIGFIRNGVAVVPDEEAPENVGSDQAHWLGLSQNERNSRIRTKIEQGPVKEKTITQEMRQIAFDNQETTDDHGMQIYGIAKDQNGSKYYMVKNSWGETGAYKGLWYASETFVKYKTTNIVINKAALPDAIAKKLGLK
ncbi:aminopeptidase C [Dysgonomonas sp. PFB1-18]|uniref:aminopeptidase C n=1 Tax=unclassified Dysgonomonas TaxID=2630389 RepID=UPI0024734E51|nr:MULTISPECIES: C1 family peptidase [unclassified Dysgonomonas]MDH6310362.1 aminopeptidase C [Dysgonomonas sp. PF1-14]MDH6340308.1 aminopeptidase C [Dysgonomonas sp. PF1-16]MDH6381912.1 aminopeptidase C [Dysgonomonas sp. PFB1-18]MDH6399279.1 aminopeptidase C [Dysgonomonas sp. PF1-23]